MNPPLEPSVSSETRRENVLFSIVLNHNSLGSGNDVNSYQDYSLDVYRVEPLVY